MLSATPKTAIRAGKKSARPTIDPGDEAWACNSLAPGEIRHLVDLPKNGTASRRCWRMRHPRAGGLPTWPLVS